MKQRPCCVPGCSDKVSKRYAIPTDKRIRQIWLDRIENRLLYGRDNLQNYRVCVRHFNHICLEDNNKLKKYALPTLSLPEFYGDSVEDSFSYPSDTTVKQITPEKIRIALQAVPSTSTSREVSTELEVKIPQFQYPPALKKRKHEDTTSLRVQSVLEAVAGPSHQRDDICLQSEEDSTPVGSPTELSISTEQPLRPRKIKSTLQSVGVTRQSNLTPKAKVLYHKIQNLQHSMSALKSSRRKLKFIEKKLSHTNILNNLNETTGMFIMSQLRTQKYKSRGRRFTFDDKVLALAIYKHSPRAYRFLSRIFSLPSRKVLRVLLNKIPITCGINEHIFKHLRHVVENKSPIDRYCILMFDEISLDMGLEYNAKYDFVEGFVDFGHSERRAKFADHAIVFMLRGVQQKWKQPICFNFCEGTTSTPDLVRLIKNVIRESRKCGLNIIATISDQGATNRAAVNSLLTETNRYCLQNNIENRYQGYLIDDEEVIHLYDVPHLIKCIRNNMLNKNLHYTTNETEKVASWSHVIRLYEIDLNHGAFYSQFYKLTDEHIIPSKIKKMRVRNCTQVFSHTFGSAMYAQAKSSSELPSTSKFYLDPKATETAEILIFFDKLFDSFNGSSVYTQTGKSLRVALTDKSPHLNFWGDAKKVLKSMYYTTMDGQKKLTSPSIKNWIFTIDGIIYLWKKMKQDMRIKYLMPRTFNQDPIENFFSCIRSYGARNINPTCSSFITSYKSLLVNNLVSYHSTAANCEEDVSEGLLNNLKSFLNEDTPVVPDLPANVDPIVYSTNYRISNKIILQDYATPYVAGFIIRKLFTTTSISSCDSCKQFLCGTSTLPQNILITSKQYSRCSLIHPSINFSAAFHNVTKTIVNYLPYIITSYNIKRLVREKITNDHFEDISALFCLNHQGICNTYIKILTNTVIFHYIKNINKILHNRDVRRIRQDPLSYEAYQKTVKRFRI